MLKKIESPPTYESVIEESKGEKSASYRLYLHYKQKDVNCSKCMEGTLEIKDNIKFTTKNIPKFSIQSGDIPMEEVIKDYNLNDILTIVFEGDNLERLKEFSELYTSHKYWNTAHYMPKRFQLTHEYPAKCVKRIAGNVGRMHTVVTLLVVSANSKFTTKCLLDTHFQGSPRKDGNYFLHLCFPAENMKIEDRMLDSKGFSIRSYIFSELPIRSEVEKVGSGGLQALILGRYYEGPAMNFVLRSPDRASLLELNKRYIYADTPDKRPHYCNLFVVSISPESMVSVKEEPFWCPSGKVPHPTTANRVVFQSHKTFYHPYISFHDPTSS